MQQVKVIAYGNVRAGKEEEARALFRNMLEPTRAEAGCIIYEYLESAPSDENSFGDQVERSGPTIKVFVREIWANATAQRAHAQTAYFGELVVGLPAVIDGDFHVVDLIEIDPMPNGS